MLISALRESYLGMNNGEEFFSYPMSEEISECFDSINFGITLLYSYMYHFSLFQLSDVPSDCGRTLYHFRFGNALGLSHCEFRYMQVYFGY